MARQQLIHIHSGVEDKIPTSSQIELGELAINYAKDKEKIFLKNSNSEIVSFISEKVVTEELDKKVQSFVIKCNIPEYGDMMQLQTHALTGVSTSEELGIIYEAVKKSEKNCIVRIANSSGIIDEYTPVLSASYSAEGGMVLTGSRSAFPLVTEITGVIEFDTITSTYSFSATYMYGINAGSATFTMVDTDNVLSFDPSSNPSDADMLNLFSYAVSAYNMHLTVFISSNSNLKYKTGTYSSYRTTNDSIIYRVKLNSGAYQLIEIKSNEASDGLVVSEITDDDVAIIKLQFQTNQDIFSILTPLTVLSTATEVEAFIKKADSGSTIIAELYAPDNTEVPMYKGQLYTSNGVYTGIITTYGIGITVAKEETGVSATSMFLSSTHSKTISISINETGEITVENPENGTTATELIREFLYCYYYGTFSPVVQIDTKPEKYKSKILPLYDVREISNTNIKLHFPILNYDTYAWEMMELVADSTANTITASFVNWVFSNAAGIITSAGANGGYQTQEQLNTSVLTSLASKANISGSTEQVFNVATPVSDTNAATKAYVDMFISEQLATLKGEKGANNGVAELDSSGKVLSSQLPSYVDDVLEYATLANFPTTGETGKIYIAINTNLTYRWTGTTYMEISPSIALGETSATAYRGDRGKLAYDHSQTAHAPSTAQKNSDITKAEIEAKLIGAITSHTHAYASTSHAHNASNINDGTLAIARIPTGTTSTTVSLGNHTHSDYVPTSRTVAGKALTANITLAKGDVGLGSVDNTSDANKPVSTAQQTALNAKMDSNKFQVVASLPASPVSGTFYFVKE